MQTFYLNWINLALTLKAGFKEIRHVSAATLTERYFMGRMDGLRLPNNLEELLMGTAKNSLSL